MRVVLDTNVIVSGLNFPGEVFADILGYDAAKVVGLREAGVV